MSDSLVRPRGSGPLYRRIYRDVRRGVLEGRLAPGTRLPSTRSLARDLAVSRTVAVQAYEMLEAEGYVEGRVGAGTFVRRDLPEDLLRAPDAGLRPPAASPARPRLSTWSRRVLRTRDGPGRPGSAVRDPERRHGELPYDFRYGRPDPRALPARTWRRAVSRASRTVGRGYADPAGSPALREALAEHLARTRSVQSDPGQLLVVTGSQQALDLTARVLLDAGDGVLLEDPHYPGARSVFRAAGARIRAVPVDEEGLDVGRLPERGPWPRLVVVTPSHQFPMGAILSLTRRLQLLDWAERSDALILEDDYDGEFRYDAPPVEAIHALDRSGRVIYAGTLSKLLFPGLRLGYVVAPRPLVDAFRAAKWLTDRHTPLLQQEAVATLLREGELDRHLRRSRVRNAGRRDALLESLDRELGDAVRVGGAEAGVHVVVRLPGLDGETLEELVRDAAGRGVGVYPLAPYFLEAREEPALLMGYAALDEERIREGVRRLAEAVRACKLAAASER